MLELELHRSQVNIQVEPCPPLVCLFCAQRFHPVDRDIKNQHLTWWSGCYSLSQHQPEWQTSAASSSCLWPVPAQSLHYSDVVSNIGAAKNDEILTSLFLSILSFTSRAALLFCRGPCYSAHKWSSIEKWWEKHTDTLYSQDWEIFDWYGMWRLTSGTVLLVAGIFAERPDEA